MWRAKNRAVPVHERTWRPRLARLSVPACGRFHHSPASPPARTRRSGRKVSPVISPTQVDSMKNPSQRVFRMKIRKLRKETQAANEDVALFLGPKLLGELRILMRLASNGRSTN